MPDGSTIMTPPAGSAPAAPPPQAAAPASAPPSGPAIVPGAPPASAPPAPAEGYTDFTLPEGIEVNAGLLEAFKPLAKEYGLSQAQAQKLVDLQAQDMKARVEAQTAAWDTTMTEWQNTARADKEYGGVKFDEHVALATNALKKYGTPELVKALELTGMGNHPEMIRFAYRVGKATGEAPMIPGSSAPSGEHDPAKVLFPNMV